jgi:uncharacterized protein YjiS (DUF1127 family)
MGANLPLRDLLEVEIMSNQQCASLERPLSSAFLHSPVRFIYETVIDPVRRRARGRADAWQLARLDDHLLRDIGLTRAQVLAAAFGPAGASGLARARPSGPDNVVRLKRLASVARIDRSGAASLARRAARG